jgi:hypothetical protein
MMIRGIVRAASAFAANPLAPSSPRPATTFPLLGQTASSVVGGAGSVLCQLSVSDAPRLDSSWWARTSLSRVRVSWMPSRGVLLSCPDFVWNT